MRGLPIRIKLTAAFAAATLLVLLAAATFVWLRLRVDRDEAVEANLRARADAAVSAYLAGARMTAVALEDPEESFVQSFDRRGQVLQTGGNVGEASLLPVDVQRALTAPLLVERDLDGVDGTARVLTRTVDGLDGLVVIAVGQSLNDRNDALASVVTSFAIGGAGGLVVASVVGYALAGAALAPVEAMRRRARDISLSDVDVLLPLPPSHDEIRRLGETLNEMLARLRASFVREGRFVADASHELRTPIAVIRTEIEGLLHLGGHPREVTQALQSASAECDRLAMLADDLLIIARTTDGGLPVRRQQIELRELVVEVRTRFAERAADQGRFVAVEIPAGLMASADPERLRQVIVNVLDNALRHGAGDVSITGWISAADRERVLTIEVRDAGPGFPADFVGQAFQPFARAHGDRTRGAGLGLAIVHAIVSAHGGTSVAQPGPPGVVTLTIPEYLDRP